MADPGLRSYLYSQADRAMQELLSKGAISSQGHAEIMKILHQEQGGGQQMGYPAYPNQQPQYQQYPSGYTEQGQYQNNNQVLLPASEHKMLSKHALHDDVMPCLGLVVNVKPGCLIDCLPVNAATSTVQSTTTATSSSPATSGGAPTPATRKASLTDGCLWQANGWVTHIPAFIQTCFGEGSSSKLILIIYAVFTMQCIDLHVISMPLWQVFSRIVFYSGLTAISIVSLVLLMLGAGNNVVNGVSSGFGLTIGSDIANSLWHRA